MVGSGGHRGDGGDEGVQQVGHGRDVVLVVGVVGCSVEEELDLQGVVVGVEPGRGGYFTAFGEPDVSSALDVVEGDRLQVVVGWFVVQVAEGVGGGGVECGAWPVGDADPGDDGQ